MKIALIIMLFSALIFPNTVLAECNPLTSPLSKECTSTQTGMGSPSNWLPQIKIPGVLSGDIDFVTMTTVPFVIDVLLFLIMLSSLVMLIVGGIMWITSSGEKEAKAKAKGTVTYALIGLALGLGSFIILNTLGLFLGLKF